MAPWRSCPFLLERALSRKVEEKKLEGEFNHAFKFQPIQIWNMSKPWAGVFFCKSLSLLGGFNFKLTEMQQLKAICIQLMLAPLSGPNSRFLTCKNVRSSTLFSSWLDYKDKKKTFFFKGAYIKAQKLFQFQQKSVWSVFLFPYFPFLPSLYLYQILHTISCSFCDKNNNQHSKSSI